MKLLKNLNPLNYKKRTRGAIALFMAVLLTPFLSVAMILVETGRYNSAVSIADEAMGVSSISVLSNYDTYLHDRWGLMAVDQEADINALFVNSLKTNTGVLGESISINSSFANGIYPLSDSEILYNQIMEYCKLNAPTKLATNFLNLSDIINKLEEFKNINNILKTITSGTKFIDSAISLSESTEKLKELAEDLDDLSNTYSTNYSSFESNSNALIDALKEGRPDDEEKAKEYDKNLKTLKEDAKTSATNYSNTISDIIDELNEYKTALSDQSDAMADLHENEASLVESSVATVEARKEKNKELKECNDKLSKWDEEGFSDKDKAYSETLATRNKLEEELASSAVDESVLSTSKDGISSFTDDWADDWTFSNFENTIINEIESFTALKTKVDSFSASANTEKINSDNYHNVNVSGYIPSDKVDEYIQKQSENLHNGSLVSLAKAIVKFFKSILGTSVFYESGLSSVINTSFYDDNLGGLPGEDSAEGGVLAIITSIASLITDITTISTDLVTLNLTDTLKQIKNTIEDIEDLIDSINDFIVGIVNNIIDLFSDCDRLYYSTYTTFNLSCRTDYDDDELSFNAMTGYNLTSDTLPQNGKNKTGFGLVDDLSALVNTLKSAISGGGDYTFSGAELEYVLFGSNSELANQAYTFVSLYLLRLLLDIPTVLSNGEVQSMATAATLGYPVVMFIEILAEPLAETILLVNGSKIPLIASPVYLTPSKISEFIEAIFDSCDFTTSDKDDITSGFVSAFGETKDEYKYQKTLYDYEYPDSGSGSGFLKLDYREYCFLLLLLTVTKEQQMGRISNLIQMETYYYYHTKKSNFTFDLKKSYTYVESNTNISIKQLLPSLANSTFFTIDRKMYRGY